MKCYNIQNYIRYKEDVKQRMKRIDMTQIYDEYTRDELIIKFMPLVENLARKFSTAQQASGVMNINDLIQEANKNLIIETNARPVYRIEEGITTPNGTQIRRRTLQI